MSTGAYGSLNQHVPGLIGVMVSNLPSLTARGFRVVVGSGVSHSRGHLMFGFCKLRLQELRAASSSSFLLILLGASSLHVTFISSPHPHIL